MHLRRILAVVLGAVLLASACSSDGGGAAAGPTATPVILVDPSTPEVVEEVRRPTMFDAVDEVVNPDIPARSGGSRVETGPDEPIVIGGLATETIDGEPVLPGVCAGAEARLTRAAVNQELTRPVEWLGCSDDAGFPDRFDVGLDRLLFRDPMAIVPLISNTFFAADRLNAEAVPYIGLGSQPAYCGIENGFGFGIGGALNCPVLDVLGITTSGPVIQAWLGASETDGTGLRVVHVVDGSVSGIERARSRALEIESVGAELVLVDDTLLGAAHTDADLDRVTAGIVATPNDLVVVEVSQAQGLYPRLRAAGYDGEVLSTEFDPAVLATVPGLRADLADTWHVISGFSVLPQAEAGEQLATDALSVGYEPQNIGAGFVIGYASIDVFLAALADMSATGTPFTSLDLHDAINGGWRYPGITGLVCPADWPTAHLLSVPCASVVRVDAAGSAVEVVPPTLVELIVKGASDE